MSEYIFWDKFREKFSEDLIVSGITVNEIFEECEDWKAFVYIGLNDISDNKIYADCSIVEFNNSQLWNKYIGIFFYNKEKLCYQIKIIDGNRKDEIIPYDKYCSDFKIIDTIQENKLGLITSIKKGSD